MCVRKLKRLMIILLTGGVMFFIAGVNSGLCVEPEPLQPQTQPSEMSTTQQQAPVSAAPAAPGETVQPGAKEEKEETPTPSTQQKASFVPEGRIDPFRPFIESLITQQQPRPEVPLTPLQKYTISQLKLVGIIEGSKEPKALIQDSTNKGYIITKGTLIGPNNGRVVEITSDEVVVVEESTDAMGRVKEQQTVMKLRTQEEQKPN
jgi:type IV pilus assembly protein PilP